MGHGVGQRGQGGARRSARTERRGASKQNSAGRSSRAFADSTVITIITPYVPTQTTKPRQSEAGPCVLNIDVGSYGPTLDACVFTTAY
jgi:hypothetical protein